MELHRMNLGFADDDLSKYPADIQKLLKKLDDPFDKEIFNVNNKTTDQKIVEENAEEKEEGPPEKLVSQHSLDQLDPEVRRVLETLHSPDEDLFDEAASPMKEGMTAQDEFKLVSRLKNSLTKEDFDAIFSDSEIIGDLF